MIPAELFQELHRIHIKMSHLATDLFAGMYRSVFKGKGMEFEEVRPYVPGDAVRSIDWNVTARMNYPYIKRFQEERQMTLMLVVDQSASMRYGTKDASKGERLTSIAATLAFSALQNHDKVGLLLFSDRVETYLPPASNTRHVLRLIRELYLSEPKGIKTNPAAALTFLGKVQPRSGVCFFLSDFLCEDFSKQIKVIARKDDFVALCLSDPSESTFLPSGLMLMRDLETKKWAFVDTSHPARRASQERKAEEWIDLHRRAIEKAHGSWLQIGLDQDYVEELKKFFRTRLMRSH